MKLPKIAALGVFLACTARLAGAQTPDRASTVQFANSCSESVQAELQRGFALLHSFEYPETHRIFSGIMDGEPTCAMAYWGAALSFWHPLWAPPSRRDLEEGAALLERAEPLAKTPREAAYLSAASAFFSSTDPATHGARAAAYEREMERVYRGHLDDPEATVFYALAVLATVDPRDKTYARQYKAAALLDWVRSRHPEHPGVLHYLIHAYDYPGLAHLALDAAEVYAGAAPDSAHAQHMPSHIFTRLGLWERSLASNTDSTRSAAEYTRRAHLHGQYDEGLHSMDYLMYALLQTARDDQAAELLGKLDAIDATEPENFKVAYTFAAAPARYALERRRWAEAARLELGHPSFPWKDFGWAESIVHFARGLGAARSGDLALARREIAAIDALKAALPPTTLPYWSEEVQVERDAVESWVLLAEGDVDRATALAAAAADREDSVDKHPVTPGEVLPARELYADLLAASGRNDLALAEYETVLRGSPNRLNALLGAAETARASGRSDVAERFEAQIRTQTAAGDGHRERFAHLAPPAP